MNKHIIRHEDTNTQNKQLPIEKVTIGTWFWLEDEEYNDELDENVKVDRLACVTDIGSNYLKLETGYNNWLSYEWRIHFEDYEKECRYEPNPKEVIDDKVGKLNHEIQTKLNKIKLLTQRLGVQKIRSEEYDSNKALMVLNENSKGIVEYKNALIEAKDNKLPELFKDIKETSKELSYWMGLEILPMLAVAEKMEGAIDLVKDRIFSIEIYAGLTENIEHVRKGRNAAQNDKIHIMQRRCYMDEECLIDYEHGGMNFERIEEFDRWLSKPKNLMRIFPHKKCIVSFKIRRHEKDYWDENIFVRLHYPEEDKGTYLYLRNGGNLYRVKTALEFGEKLFPDINTVDENAKLWARVGFREVEEILPDRTYQQLIKDKKQNEKLKKRWEKENNCYDYWKNPHRNRTLESFEEDKWEPFNSSTVYYDDIKKYIENGIKKYNRIAIILQGILDRSEVLHPHNNIRMWDEKSFNENIQMVFDANMVIPFGEEPDFEAYRNNLNKHIKQGSVVVGQESYWEKKEAEKENERQQSDWRIREARTYKRYRPLGNPGPGYLTRVDRNMPRAKKCTFKWERERIRYSPWKGNFIPCRLTVPHSELLNVDAYTPGDYHIFFDDPRTRENYIKWAPLLLAAEDYHAGKLKIDG